MKNFYSLISLTLGISSAVAAENQEKLFPVRGDPLAVGQATPAYNMPASIQVRDAWTVSASGSLIYWIAEEEGLDLGISASLIDGSVSVPPVGVTLFQDTKYQPGFKVDMGLATNHDDWEIGLEYTWVRQNIHMSSTAPAQNLGIGVWFLSNWYIQPNGNGQTLSVTKISSKWKLHMDLLDACLSRAYYQGRFLTVNPFVGLRGALIRQALNLASMSPALPSQWLHSHTESKSWAIGPTGGLRGHWNFGWRWRLESDIGASLLYTRYTSVNHSEDATSQNTIPVSCSFGQISTLRFINDFKMGIGWGTYFYNKKVFVDILATYDFSIFWNQNLLRRLVDLETLQANSACNNLCLHGLTVALRFDF